MALDPRQARLISNHFLRFLDDSISKHKEAYSYCKYPGIVNKLKKPSDSVDFCDLRFLKIKGKFWVRARREPRIRQHFLSTAPRMIRRAVLFGHLARLCRSEATLL